MHGTSVPVEEPSTASKPDVSNRSKAALIRSPEAVRAVHRTATLDRAKIRAEFERRFSCERMAREYVEIYKALAAAP